jgi:hypothetical protein
MGRFLDERAARRVARAAADGRDPAEAKPSVPASAGPTVADPVPPFHVRQLTIEDGLAVASWSRPGAWRIEDALEAPEPDELQRGFVLTCQSHPVTDRVVVDFDQ